MEDHYSQKIAAYFNTQRDSPLEQFTAVPTQRFPVDIIANWTREAPMDKRIALYYTQTAPGRGNSVSKKVGYITHQRTIPDAGDPDETIYEKIRIKINRPIPLQKGILSPCEIQLRRSVRNCDGDNALYARQDFILGCFRKIPADLTAILPGELIK